MSRPRTAVLLVVLAAAGCRTAREPVGRGMRASAPRATPVRVRQPPPPRDTAPTLPDPTPDPSLRRAYAVVAPAPGFHAKGTVRFEAVDFGTEVQAALDNLPGTHVYALHAGTCTEPGPELAQLGVLRDDGRITSTHRTWLDDETIASVPGIVGHVVVVWWASENPFLRERPERRVGCGVVTAGEAPITPPPTRER